MNKFLKVIAVGLLFCSGLAAAQVPAQRPVVLPEGYITGNVSSSNGPEAGVWVIAETGELNTNFIKIVVTDEDGNYVMPELPVATYSVWVRGYGLADSEAVEGRPGDRDLDLTAIVASSAAEAAEIYPADYWLSLVEFPSDETLSPDSADRQGFSPVIDSQKRFIHEFKSDCGFCHQIGNEITRTLGHMDALGHDSSKAAWIYRTQTGVRGGSMFGNFAQFGLDGMATTMSSWTDTIEEGTLPPIPARPEGIERNVVVTLRDMGGDHDFMHDQITTDKNDPTVNAFGPTYAVSSGHGALVVVDPITNDSYQMIIPTRTDAREVDSRFPPAGQPSNFWGRDHLWGPEHPSDPHNAMLGPDARVWMTSKVRNNNDQPSWCQRGSGNKFAEYYPLTFSIRQASVYDPDSGEFDLIDTCFHTHHLQFASDADNTLYFNELLGPIFGWVNTRLFDQTHDEELAQGWCPQIVDTNGDGVITKPWNAWGEEVDPSLDTELRANLYTVIPDPIDGNVVWGANENSLLHPYGSIVRLDRGNNPPETCVTEVYAIPDPGFDPRGLDITSDGVIWAALAGSSHWARFDRNECAVTNGAGTEMGMHCPEGWTLYQTDGPKLAGTDVPADFHYFGWVDQHNVSGLGKDTPIITGSFSDSLIALEPETGDWTRFRVPYPLGFYQRGLDGRIDDPDTGWKGRSLWANYGTHLIWHVEGGKGTKGKMVQFQIRPDALAH